MAAGIGNGALSGRMSMGKILILVMAAAVLSACATPAMRMNANAGQQQMADRTDPDKEPPVPIIFRRPQPTLRNWGSQGAGGMY